jgi:hypothetical protein
MSDPTAHRAALAALPRAGWDAYLDQHSGLPGPRANLELLQIAADLGTPAQFRRWAALPPPAEYLPACGAVGLGRLLAEGDAAALPALCVLANDPRWRVREGVAMALQRWGDADLAALVKAMPAWAKGTWLEQRAAAAGLCEPRLLKNHPAAARRTLALLDTITRRLAQAAPAERKTDAYKALRKGLAYCWSVAVVALPAEGLAALETWLPSADPDVQWIMQQNLKKDRLRRLDPAWVARWQPPPRPHRALNKTTRQT